MIKVSTSLLSIKNNLIDTIELLNKTNTDYFHIDVMDGKFVDNKSFMMSDIKKVANNTSKPLDVHLMVNNPKHYIDELALYNVDYITFHYEINNIDKYIKQIKDYGIKCGISLKPKTSIQEMIPYLDKIDMVLIMSVEPGYGGQSFIEDSVLKIKELRKLDPNIIIEVDGGINEDNAKECIEAGTNILVSGSYITHSDNYQSAIDKLRFK